MKPSIWIEVCSRYTDLQDQRARLIIKAEGSHVLLCQLTSIDFSVGQSTVVSGGEPLKSLCWSQRTTEENILSCPFTWG